MKQRGLARLHVGRRAPFAARLFLNPGERVPAPGQPGALSQTYHRLSVWQIPIQLHARIRKSYVIDITSQQFAAQFEFNLECVRYHGQRIHDGQPGQSGKLTQSNSSLL